MALSTGGLAAIIVVIMLLHAGAFLGVYLRLQKTGGKPPVIAEKWHPTFRWILLGLIPVSWMFSIGATAACTFISINDNIDESEGDDATLGFSAFNTSPRDESSECTSLSDVDVFTKAFVDGIGISYSFAIFNCLLTTMGMALIILLQFVLANTRNVAWMVLRIAMYTSLWCCLFTFYIQELPACEVVGVTCSLGPAGIAQVFNVLILIAINILLFITGCGEKNTQPSDANAAGDKGVDQKEDPEAGWGQHPEEIVSPSLETETHLPDGTIQREVETTNPDGSKTITRTIEEPDDDDDDGDDEDFVNLPSDEEEEPSPPSPPESDASEESDESDSSDKQEYTSDSNA